MFALCFTLNVYCHFFERAAVGCGWLSYDRLMWGGAKVGQPVLESCCLRQRGPIFGGLCTLHWLCSLQIVHQISTLNGPVSCSHLFPFLLFRLCELWDVVAFLWGM